MSYDRGTLNEEQLKPVLDTEGAVLVTAGAGSGKTRMLTHRIAHLITDNNVQPYNILAITFTNKAANEMKERLEKMIPSARGLWVSTFHSMCVSFLRKFIDRIGYTQNFSIYGENEKERSVKRIVKTLLEKHNIDPDDSDKVVKSALFFIAGAKNDGLSPDDFYKRNSYVENAELIRDTFIAYEDELKQNNALDFDDLLIKAYYLLSNVQDALEYYSDRFHYIHVDEFQDTNIIQYKIVKALSSKHKNIFIVGDQDQSIYGWRGASIANMSEFMSDYNAKVYKLEQNYRSTKKIIALANKLISANASALRKTLWTQNQDGDNIQIFTAPSEGKEAEYVVSAINSLVLNEGYSYSDFAVLMRINALSRAFEEKLIQYQIPHRIFGGFKFYERKEIKDILAYFRIVSNPADREAIERVINFPKRGVGDAALEQIKNYSFGKGITLYDAVLSTLGDNDDLPPALIKKIRPFATVLACLNNEKGNIKLSALLRYLIKLINLKEVFADDTEENENKKQNIRELVNSVEQYENMNPEAGLDDYLQNVSLYSDMDEPEDTSCVNIATVHSAKGLEFKVVFVVGLEDGIFPVTRAMDSNADMEEERRLLYVAITRAMERLYLSYSSSRYLYNGRKDTVPSRFLSELGFKPAYKRESMYDNYNESRWYNRENKNTDTASGSGSSYSGFSARTTNPTPQTAPRDTSGILAGVKVNHKKFGEGIVLSVSGEEGNLYAEIEFPQVGKLLLSLNFAPLEVVK